MYKYTPLFTILITITLFLALPFPPLANEIFFESEYIKPIVKEDDKSYNIIKARVTAYSPLDNKSGISADNNPNITSCGTNPSRGTIAVDPSRIPYGTKIYIPGYGNGVAEDTGGALREYEGIAIDICVDTYEEAMKWGVKHIDVYLILK